MLMKPPQIINCQLSPSSNCLCCKTEHCFLETTVPWPQFICAYHSMTFGIHKTKNSYPQLEIRLVVGWRSLNCASSYDVILPHSDIKLIPTTWGHQWCWMEDSELCLWMWYNILIDAYIENVFLSLINYMSRRYWHCPDFEWHPTIHPIYHLLKCHLEHNSVQRCLQILVYLL